MSAGLINALIILSQIVLATIIFVVLFKFGCWKVCFIRISNGDVGSSCLDSVRIPVLDSRAFAGVHVVPAPLVHSSSVGHTHGLHNLGFCSL